ncbi:hypothetical protein YTPLAS18_04750 [Nitrospira sp.]|nr:hypothetical protein YTPLAS18_04750 [Nitrospira sp.]
MPTMKPDGREEPDVPHPRRAKRLWRLGSGEESSIRDYVWGAALVTLGLLVGLGLMYVIVG